MMIVADTKDSHHPIANKEFRAALRQLKKEGALTVNDGVIRVGFDIRKSFTNFATGKQQWYFSINVEGFSRQDFGPYDDARTMLLARDR